MRCFSAGEVKGDPGGGGLVGESEGRILNCLWDVQASGVGQSAGGLGFGTSEMMSSQVYTLNGWAGDPNWVLDEGRDYPHLAWEGTAGQPIPEPTIDWLSGSGTAEVPFKIQSPQQLNAIAHTSILWDKHFVLDADLDLADVMFEPIAGGASPGFTGVFDGAGHTIRNLTIRRDNQGAQYVGLFGKVGSTGQIRNLSIEDANVVSASLASFVGVLAGASDGSVNGCRATGRIRCGNNSNSVGGLIGYSNGTIHDCHANVAIAAGGGFAIGGLLGSHWGSPMEACSAAGSIEITGDGDNFGGLVGYNAEPIARCFASGSVTAAGDSGQMGGLIGGNAGATVADCYATGRVQGGGWLGALIGYSWYSGSPGEIARCWAAGQVIGQQGAWYVGGLVGYSDAGITSGYRLNLNSGGGPDYRSGTPLTDEQMKQKASFVDWDFETVWSICEGKDYPRLRWEQVECP